MYTERVTKMAKMTRINEITAKNLDELAKTMGKSKQFIMEQALKAYAREQFLKKTNEEYAQLKQDSKAYTDYIRENKDWDITLQDGLDIYEE
jgi:hypothetical protein